MGHPVTDIQLTKGIYPSAIMIHALLLFARKHLPTDEDTSMGEIFQAIEESPAHIKRLGKALQHALMELYRIDKQNSKGENPIGKEQAQKVYQLPESMIMGKIQHVTSVAITAYSHKHHPDLYNAIVDQYIADDLGLQPKTIEPCDDPDMECIQKASMRIRKAINHFTEITGSAP